MEEAQDKIHALISQITQAKTIAEREVLQRSLLTQFNFYVGEVNQLHLDLDLMLNPGY